MIKKIFNIIEIITLLYYTVKYLNNVKDFFKVISLFSTIK